MPAAPPVIAIVGATATGKTSVAIRVADALGGEIVSCDSMQVYRGMDIGTAKATAQERRRIPHHLLDVANPDEQLDARQYADLAAQAITAIRRRGAVPIVVGGTGLWLRSLLEGLMPAPAADPEIRARLEALARDKGPGALHARLSVADPEAAGRIHRNDSVRVIRALEVFELTGRTISDHQRAHRERLASELPYDALPLGLSEGRDALYERIDERTGSMFEAGFVGEVEALLAAGYGRRLRPMGALGYKHVCAALAGEILMEDAVRLTQRDTRRYAKRQATWFANDPAIHWLGSPADATAAIERAREFLETRT